jgi:hypothetical protein
VQRSCLDHRIEVMVGDVLDVRLSGKQPFHPRCIDVERNDLVADLRGADRQRQPDVSLPDHYDAHFPPSL